jgi:hypothetical protein
MIVLAAYMFMKKLFLLLALCCITALAYAQQQFLSYEDIVYLETNNLQKINDFMQSKGYSTIKTKKQGTLKFALQSGGNTTDIEIRSDGKRVYIYIATDEIQQVNLLNNSIQPYLQSTEENSGITIFKVKDLGIIYTSSNDKVPYSPIKRDYDIRIVSDSNITAYN